MKKNKNVFIILVSILFFFVGAFLTFFLGNTNTYDSKAKAYKIYSNKIVDEEDGFLYYPVYMFRVDDNEYECKTQTGSRFEPKKSKNLVYYSSSNPEDCMTQYDKSNSSILGITFIISSIVIFFVLVIKKPSNRVSEYNQVSEPIDPELAQKVDKIMDTAQLVYKRIVLGIIIIILLFLIFVDSMLFKQTIKAKDYIDATATYVDTKTDSYSSFVDYIYTFSDKDGNQHEITISYHVAQVRDDEIKIKYNVDNPQDFYEESALLNTSGVVWYIVKMVLIILLTILFFNKKLLSRIGMSLSKNKE